MTPPKSRCAWVPADDALYVAAIILALAPRSKIVEPRLVASAVLAAIAILVTHEDPVAVIVIAVSGQIPVAAAMTSVLSLSAFRVARVISELVGIIPGPALRPGPVLSAVAIRRAGASAP